MGVAPRAHAGHEGSKLRQSGSFSKREICRGAHRRVKEASALLTTGPGVRYHSLHDLVPQARHRRLFENQV